MYQPIKDKFTEEILNRNRKYSYVEEFFVIDDEPFNLLFDEELVLRMVSKNYLDLTGIAVDNVLNKPLQNLTKQLNLDDETAAKIQEELSSIFVGVEKPTRLLQISSLQHLFPFEREFCKKVFLTKLKERNAQFCSVYAINFDLAPIKKRITKLQKANKVLANFVDLTFHDLNNKISVIESTIDLFLETNKSVFLQKLFKALNEVNKQIDVLQKVKANIMSQQQLRMVNLEDVFRKLREKYKHATKMDVIIDINEDINVIGDELLTYVLENLIDNAIHHSNAQSVHVFVDNKSDKICHIFIKDDGVGIPKSFHKRLFKEKLITNTTRQGIGLMIISSIVESYGGSITFKQNVPSGSIFIIKLRLAEKMKKGLQKEGVLEAYEAN